MVNYESKKDCKMGDSGKIEVHILEAICKIEKNTNLIKIGGSPIRNLIFSLPHKK